MKIFKIADKILKYRKTTTIQSPKNIKSSIHTSRFHKNYSVIVPHIPSDVKEIGPGFKIKQPITDMFFIQDQLQVQTTTSLFSYDTYGNIIQSKGIPNRFISSNPIYQQRCSILCFPVPMRQRWRFLIGIQIKYLIVLY